MGLVTCRCPASARFPPSAEPVNRRHRRTSAPAPVDPELRGIVEDFERLWRLVAALRRAQQRGEPVPGRDLDALADALIGFYLSRRLCRRTLDDWALTAIATIIC